MTVYYVINCSRHVVNACIQHPGRYADMTSYPVLE